MDKKQKVTYHGSDDSFVYSQRNNNSKNKQKLFSSSADVYEDDYVTNKFTQNLANNLFGEKDVNGSHMKSNTSHMKNNEKDAKGGIFNENSERYQAQKSNTRNNLQTKNNLKNKSSLNIFQNDSAKNKNMDNTNSTTVYATKYNNSDYNDIDNYSNNYSNDMDDMSSTRNNFCDENQIEKQVNAAVEKRNKMMFLKLFEYFYLAVINTYKYMKQFMTVSLILGIFIWKIFNSFNTCTITNTLIDANLSNINLATLNNASVVEISKLYKYGYFGKNKTHVDSLMMENNACTALENRRNAFVKIKMRNFHKIKRIALFHPAQGNPSSCIKDFKVCFKENEEYKELPFTFEKDKRYQEFNINAIVNGFKIKILSNYGGKYISIYRVYAIGH